MADRPWRCQSTECASGCRTISRSLRPSRSRTVSHAGHAVSRSHQPLADDALLQWIATMPWSRSRVRWLDAYHRQDRAYGGAIN